MISIDGIAAAVVVTSLALLLASAIYLWRIPGRRPHQTIAWAILTVTVLVVTAIVAVQR